MTIDKESNNKFRLRYLFNNKIYDVFAIDFFNKSAQLVSEDRKEILFKKFEYEYLMLCTGRRDKNGTLIYEDDVVKEEIYGYKPIIKIVSFIDDVMTGFNLNSEGTYEIVGNIHKTPDLMRDGDNADL